MHDNIKWDEERAGHIRSRSQRYPGALNLEPAWTQEAWRDPDRVTQNPDPKSRTGAMRIIGYSASAQVVLTVIIDPVTLHGITAWKATGADLTRYLTTERGAS